MKCPYCNEIELSVLESRDSEDGASVRRRRRCERCKKRFTTYERVEGVELVVVKKDGREEHFDREKLKKGIMKATWKRPVSLDQIEQMVSEVERKLRIRKGTKVKSWEIGKLVINRLKKVDKVAYLLFASVYKDFKNLEDFKKEIEELKNN